MDEQIVDGIRIRRRQRREPLKRKHAVDAIPGDEASESLPGRVEHLRVADRQDTAPPTGFFTELARMGRAQGHGLFDQDMPPVMKAAQRLDVVMLVGARNDQGIAGTDKLPEIGVRPQRGGRVAVVDANQPKILTRGQGQHGLDVARSHAAGSDDTDANHRRRIPEIGFQTQMRSILVDMVSDRFVQSLHAKQQPASSRQESVVPPGQPKPAVRKWDAMGEGRSSRRAGDVRQSSARAASGGDVRGVGHGRAAAGGPELGGEIELGQLWG